MTTSVPPRRLTKAERQRQALTDGVLPERVVDEAKCHIPVVSEPLATLGDAPNLGYFRKSSEDQEKQTLSIPAQRKEVEGAASQSLTLSWWESYSGTTFKQRPAFMALLEFCRKNPQPADNPGTIWAWDYDRFSRQQIELKGEKRPHVKAMLKMLLEFDEYGWRWHFVKSPPMGYELGDLIMGLVKFEQAGGYSSKLSGDVKRNKDLKTLDETEGGYWVGGTPPYPALRVDAVTGRVMQPTEWTQPEHGVILAPNPDWVATWELAARRILEGWSPQRVADYLNVLKAPLGPTMVSWHRRTVVRMLTNTALIGWPVYGAHTGQGRTYKARWAPIVDPELFEAAKARLESRQRGRQEQNQWASAKPLLLTCPKCDAVYHQRMLPTGRRLYYHPSPRGARSSEWNRRAQEAGCRCHTLDAETVETAVFALILEQRGSPEFIDMMRREWTRQQQKEARAADGTGALRSAYDQARQEYELFMQNLAQLDPQFLPDFQRQLAERKQLMEVRKAAWMRAEKDAPTGRWQWHDQLQEELKELKLLEQTWETASLENRRCIFRYWVEGIDVYPIPLPEPKRRTRLPVGKRLAKRLAVALVTEPERYLSLSLTDQGKQQAQKLQNSGKSRQLAILKQLQLTGWQGVTLLPGVYWIEIPAYLL